MQEINLNIDEYNVKRWFKKGTNILHREDGPAFQDTNGDKAWYQNGLLHREDGPAIEYWDGSKFWYKNGKRHNKNGPAIEWHNETQFWYIEGKQYSEIEFYLYKNNFIYNDENKELIINIKKYKLISIDD